MSGAARRFCIFDGNRTCEPSCAGSLSAVGPWGSFCIIVEAAGSTGIALGKLSGAADNLQAGLGAVPTGILSKFAGVLLGGGKRRGPHDV